MLTKPDLVAAIDFHFVPWGNAYCETSVCPSSSPGSYEVSVRQCWDSKCGGASAPSDCFSCTDDFTQTCQHGHDECVGNRLEACAQALYPEPAVWWPFVACFEGKYHGDISFAESCAKSTGLSYAKLETCVNGDQGASLDKANAMTTTTQAHPGTPFVLVNGKQLDNVDELLKTICNEITGPKPASCGALYEQHNASSFTLSV